MNDNDLNIPLLDDLVTRGHIEADEESNQQDLLFDENSDIELESEKEAAEEFSEPGNDQQQDSEPSIKTSEKDELTQDASVKELIVDEEIRLILDKHMDQAYEEIIRLLNQKIN